MNLNLVRRFFKFTVPSIVSMWIFSLYSLVDGMFVAWGVGEHALTAVNLSLPFVSLVFTLGILLATGTSTVLSIALGQKDVERARNYFNQNLFVVIAATLLLAVLVLFNLDWVADFLGATGENHHLVKEYVGVIACFSVFFTVSYNLEVQVKADGAPHVSIIGVISCGLMNVVLDYIFVMHLHWGVWGAALATGLAQATSTAVFAVYFLTHRYPLRFILAERTKRFVLCTMAAGLPMARIQEMAGGDYPVIRIMPNTPASVGEGMIQYCSVNVTVEEEAAFCQLMAPAGRLDAVAEGMIDAASCVSGCGPAWVYQFIEALADGGVACGLPRAKAQEYAAQMVLGSAKLVLESGKHPGALKDAVCSPGGSTIQGVRVLEEHGLRGAVMDAVLAAYDKTKEMGKG